MYFVYYDTFKFPISGKKFAYLIKLQYFAEYFSFCLDDQKLCRVF